MGNDLTFTTPSSNFISEQPYHLDLIQLIKEKEFSSLEELSSNLEKRKQCLSFTYFDKEDDGPARSEAKIIANMLHSSEAKVLEVMGTYGSKF